MINPTKLPRYDFNKEQLEEFALFCIAVAGKNAKTTAFSLDYFLGSLGWDAVSSPFDLIRNRCRQADQVSHRLKKSGIGCHRMKGIAMYQLSHANIDLTTCSARNLEMQIYGIGPKTSRFFVLHTRRDAEVACLDTHILKFLRSLGYNTPNSTPTGKKYEELENIFLKEAGKRQLTPAELDISIWKEYSGHHDIYQIPGGSDADCMGDIHLLNSK